MKVNTETLISELIELTRQNLNKAESFKELELNQLNHKEDPKSWSMLECLEHLNLYGDFYLPEIESRINKSNHPPVEEFKGGMLGNYFAKMMKVEGDKIKKMQTPKDKNPNGSQLEKDCIARFVEQQHKTLDLLDKARMVNLMKTKTGTSLSNLVKMKLGDTFRFVIYHNERHLIQAENVQKRPKEKIV